VPPGQSQVERHGDPVSSCHVGADAPGLPVGSLPLDRSHA